MKLSFSKLVRFAKFLAIAGLLLAGCNTAPTAIPLPTQDPATLVAEAVKTLGAQMTEEAIRNPSPTPTPTVTPTPTDTPIPPTPTPDAPTLTPTATATSAPLISAKFITAGTFPENKFKYVPNEKFSLAIRFLNTGTYGWDAGYKLKLVSAQGEITVQPEATLGTGVDPGKAAEFDLWAFGSETLGRHTWFFQLYSSAGVPVPGGSAAFSYESY